jgi:uncharacterized damage-inducible protein DinB
MNLKTELKSQSIFRMTENTERIEKCLKLLPNKQVWYTYNNHTNSIGHLILHLCGNITQYIQSSLGNQKDDRNRDSEFETEIHLSNEDLAQKMRQTAEEAAQVINQLSEEELLKERAVQGFHFTGVGSIIHVVEHYSYHTGQIALQTKLLQNLDLGFYADLDLNIKNE